MSHPVTAKISESHRRTAARLVAAAAKAEPVPPVPVEPAPEVALPGPSMRELRAAATAAQDAATLQAAKAFFASSRPVAVHGIPRFRTYEAETKHLLAVVDAYEIDTGALHQMQCPLVVEYERALAEVQGILSSPRVAQDALNTVDGLTAKDCEVSWQERAAGLTLPEHFHALRNALHRVGQGTDRIEGALTRLRDLLPRVVGWYAGKLAERRPTQGTEE